MACAAKLLGMAATVVMPSDAPTVKIASTRAHGAEVVLYNRATDDRAAIATEIAARTNAVFVHPFDDPDIMAGQGTTALEFLAQLEAEWGVNGQGLDQVLVCCSGGGLSSGIAGVLEVGAPACEVLTVEPAGFDKMRRSLAAGERCSNPHPTGSICDALLAVTPGERTFAALARRGARGLAVTDDEVRAAMKFAFDHLKLVLEPGGAAALAAALQNEGGRLSGKTTVIIASGGNVDVELYRTVLG